MLSWGHMPTGNGRNSSRCKVLTARAQLANVSSFVHFVTHSPRVMATPGGLLSAQSPICSHYSQEQILQDEVNRGVVRGRLNNLTTFVRHAPGPRGK